jgi:hypothetical protein
MGFGTGQTGQYTAGALSGGQTSTVEGLPQKQASAPNLPGYLGLPFRIIVSPFARFDPATRSTDILMFNSQNLGALVVKEDPHVQNWEDARYGIQEMFIEESYGSAMADSFPFCGRSEHLYLGFCPCRALCHHRKTVRLQRRRDKQSIPFQQLPARPAWHKSIFE